ncbi:MAG: hypothetical protein ACE5JL_09120 [Dehalococcoidia bacterium]
MAKQLASERIELDGTLQARGYLWDQINHIASLGNPWPLLIINGPQVLDLEFNSGTYVFGPDNRSNATVGRALSLILANCMEVLAVDAIILEKMGIPVAAIGADTLIETMGRAIAQTHGYPVYPFMSVPHYHRAVEEDVQRPIEVLLPQIEEILQNGS